MPDWAPRALQLAASRFLTTPPEATAEKLERLAEVYTSIFGTSNWSHGPGVFSRSADGLSGFEEDG